MPASDRDLYRLAADIGGTFTDIVLLAPDGRYWARKVASTPDAYARAILAGLRQILAEQALRGADLLEVVHGTTVATNAILEHKVAKTALLTTRGFRDVLELRRLRVPHLYNLFYRPPRPLVERRLRLEVDERLGADGEVVRRLDEASVEAALERIRLDGAQAVAVSLLHSYRNPAHERRVGELVRKQLPGCYVSLSVDVLPEIREYERTSTTVINAALGPIMQSYLDSLVRELRHLGVTAPVRMMQSSGGIMSAQKAAETPAHVVESGPAAGAVAAQLLGRRIGLDHLISFDMGGTTAKASLVEGGALERTTEYEVGAGVSLSSRLVKGGGHALKVPVIDLAEVGAGGGSIVWLDRGGALKVGPQSAGAMPGPVCYGLGGTEPTVTDANVVLGYINPKDLAGGAVRLQLQRAEAVLQESVAEPLGMGLLEAAYGVHTVANVSMTRALKAVSTYRGRDPRDSALLAFGGSGPVHAATLAQSLGMKRVIVPPAPGVFSAIGLLEAIPRHDFVQTFFAAAGSVDPISLEGSYAELESRAQEALGEEGYHGDAIVWSRAADLRYSGQAYELTVPVPARGLGRRDVATLIERFHAEHERTYGHAAPTEPVEIVNVRLTASGKTGSVRPQQPMVSPGVTRSDVREAFFGADHGLLRTEVMERSDLSGTPRLGPFIVEEYDATVVVPPGCAARLDEWQNIVMDIGAE